jgi:fructose-1,6-bisphosphatase/inositol monophosphatase family enzyme
LPIDTIALYGILRDAGKREITPRFRALAADDIAHKSSSFDLVTAADLGAEAIITAALRESFPTAMILGEEAYAADPRTMDGLAEAELAFVIDPVDGTFNFAAGNALFGTLLAVVRRGETVAGIVYDPLHGHALLAEKGAGARMFSPDGSSVPIRVAPPVPLAEMVSVAVLHYLPQPTRSHAAAALAKVRMSLAYGCSAHEYWMLNTGRAHFLAGHRMMPWDHLAGTLVHAEAGGYNAHFDGSAYRPGDIEGGLLCAPDKESWSVIRREILGMS